LAITAMHTSELKGAQLFCPETAVTKDADDEPISFGLCGCFEAVNLVMIKDVEDSSRQSWKGWTLNLSLPFLLTPVQEASNRPNVGMD
jgi:hypothetical protein